MQNNAPRWMEKFHIDLNWHCWNWVNFKVGAKEHIVCRLRYAYIFIYGCFSANFGALLLSI